MGDSGAISSQGYADPVSSFFRWRDQAARLFYIDICMQEPRGAGTVGLRMYGAGRDSSRQRS
ncbi:hypothetical protein BER92_00375 [Xanthomonas fragariae]|nr:hypothetical protein BER92_00375 [Xanthomonas fragariae]